MLAFGKAVSDESFLSIVTPASLEINKIFLQNPTFEGT